MCDNLHEPIPLSTLNNGLTLYMLFASTVKASVLT